MGVGGVSSNSTKGGGGQENIISKMEHFEQILHKQWLSNICKIHAISCFEKKYNCIKIMISFKVTFLGHKTSWLSNTLLVQETIFAKKLS